MLEICRSEDCGVGRPDWLDARLTSSLVRVRGERHVTITGRVAGVLVFDGRPLERPDA